MRITIIPEDQIIIVDGVGYRCEFDAPGIHAIQWHGDHGTIERTAGGGEWTDDIGVVQPYLNLWTVAHTLATAPPPPPPPPTPDQIKAALVAAVQAHLNATAAAYGYDNIYTACTYADEPSVALFQAEGQALRAWRSLVWAHCHQVMADVMAEKRAVPSAEELIAELPALVMP